MDIIAHYSAGVVVWVLRTLVETSRQHTEKPVSDTIAFPIFSGDRHKVGVTDTKRDLIAPYSCFFSMWRIIKYAVKASMVIATETIN